jgi:hypothetical protein
LSCATSSHSCSDSLILSRHLARRVIQKQKAATP